MKKLTGSFRTTAWDPCLLTSQIVAMQSIMYVSLCLLTAMIQDIVGSARTLDHVFQYHEIHIGDAEGRGVIAAYVLNSLVGALAMWLIVGRTKLCLDFSCTYHGLHLAACWLYNAAFPSTLSWWTLNVACCSVTCVCAELLSLRTELKAIPLANIAPKVDL